MGPSSEEILPVAFNVLILLLLSAIFSGAETAFTNLSPARMEVIRKDGKFASQLMYNLYQKLDMIISLSLILSNGVNIFLATYLAIFFTGIFGAELGGTLSATLGIILVILFGEIVPKKFAILYPVQFSRLTAHLLQFCRILIFPILLPVQLINKALDKLKKRDIEQEKAMLEEVIVATLGIGHVQGALESKEFKMMKQLLQLNDKVVKTIMTPRSDIVAIKASRSLKELVKLAKRHNLSRVPVYADSIDDIGYIVHTPQLSSFLLDAKNLDRPIIDFCVTKAFKIPESKILDDLFFEFQEKRIHMAIVLDEFGDTSGLITLEDIVEQIFGDIADETDAIEINVEEIDEGKFRAEGDSTIDEVETVSGIEFPTEFPKHKSIAWLVLHILHRFPDEGEIIEVPESNIRLEVIDKDDEYIDQVHISIV